MKILILVSVLHVTIKFTPKYLLCQGMEAVLDVLKLNHPAEHNGPPLSYCQHHD